jgi:uncharacterized membrane protein
MNADGDDFNPVVIPTLTELRDAIVRREMGIEFIEEQKPPSRARLAVVLTLALVALLALLFLITRWIE